MRSGHTSSKAITTLPATSWGAHTGRSASTEDGRGSAWHPSPTSARPYTHRGLVSQKLLDDLYQLVLLVRIQAEGETVSAPPSSLAFLILAGLPSLPPTPSIKRCEPLLQCPLSVPQTALDHLKT